MHRAPHNHRLIAILLLVWHLPSCATASWQTRTVVPQDAKRTVYAGDVRVTTTDGRTHAFRGAWVSADSLGGWLVDPAGAERAFPLADVERVQTRRPSRDTSTTPVLRLMAGYAVVGVLVVGIVAGIMCGSFCRG